MIQILAAIAAISCSHPAALTAVSGYCPACASAQGVIAAPMAQAVTYPVAPVAAPVMSYPVAAAVAAPSCSVSAYQSVVAQPVLGVGGGYGYGMAAPVLGVGGGYGYGAGAVVAQPVFGVGGFHRFKQRTVIRGNRFRQRTRIR